MNPELANRLFESGACFLCLDVPVGIKFGIDYMTWTTGDKFKGVKLIPPGLHFIHTTLSNSADGFRDGFFLNLEARQVNACHFKLRSNVHDSRCSCANGIEEKNV